jgi:hypothetical protein
MFHRLMQQMFQAVFFQLLCSGAHVFLTNAFIQFFSHHFDFAWSRESEFDRIAFDRQNGYPESHHRSQPSRPLFFSIPASQDVSLPKIFCLIG